MPWTKEDLTRTVREKLDGRQFVVVSNREPWLHVVEHGQVKVIAPASGMASALEPVASACQGLWVAHGAGDADREAVDSKDRVRVPPDDPRYTLRRVWLTNEEENGYYYGFSNSALWPLCHIVY